MSRKKPLRPFVLARELARSLGLKTRNEWREWTKSGDRPLDIPANPERDYASEWEGMGDWLGTHNKSVRDRVMWPFEQARDYVRQLGLLNYDAWRVWRKSGSRPSHIPSDPLREYGSLFQGYPDWLGIDRAVNRLPFAEAWAIARSLGVYGQKGWQQLCRDGKCPPGVPKDPAKAYPGEFPGYRLWTGIEDLPVRRPRLLLPYEEAKAIVLAQGFGSWEEWQTWREADDFPKDKIPFDPKGYYGEKWEGVAAWIGTVNRWTQKTLDKLIADVQEQVPFLQDHELYMVLHECGALPSLRMAFGGASVRQMLQALSSGDSAVLRAASIQTEQDSSSLDAAPPVDADDVLPAAVDLTQQELSVGNGTDTNQISESRVDLRGATSETGPRQPLLGLDVLLDATYGMAEGIVEDLIQHRVQCLWADCINEGREAVLSRLNVEGGRILSEMKVRFLSELAAAEELVIPAGYNFHTNDGKPSLPNLMQRHVAAVLLERSYFGNWSGAGAGKTLGGILASRATDAHLTIVVTNNSTVDQWKRQVVNAYPDSEVFTDADEAKALLRCDSNWIVLNYEKFQSKDRDELVEALLALAPDFLIFDEVHFVKQREAQTEPSRRRKALLRLRARAAEQNRNLKVLVMSGTPVLNELAEAQALLEIETDGNQGRLDTRATVNNGLRMFFALQRNGFRYRPLYEQKTLIRRIPVVQNELVRAFVAASGDLLSMERTLLAAKLDAASEFLVAGTVVYTHYTTGMIESIRSFLVAKGLKVGLFTGLDKSGLDPFKAGEIDILIGSDPIGTGLDELQYRSNRVVFLTLPWTGAMYEQIIGRLLREGSIFDDVEVVIPQVVFQQGAESFSWDQLRLARIEFKRTLSDCAVDGTIPEAVRISKAELHRQGRAALKAFLERVQWEKMLVDLPNLIVPVEDGGLCDGLTGQEE